MTEKDKRLTGRGRGFVCEHRLREIQSLGDKIEKISYLKVRRRSLFPVKNRHVVTPFLIPGSAKNSFESWSSIKIIVKVGEKVSIGPGDKAP